MIYLDSIGYYLPESEHCNADKMQEFAINEAFLQQKIGILALRRKHSAEETSDLCVQAYLDLKKKVGFTEEDIDCLVVCTQNPDGYGLPHTSAIVHEKLNLQSSCAVFDISLGCSGYVYGLSILKGFMQVNRLQRGILITADPYSKVIDEIDKNTSLLFGDAAAATLLSCQPANQAQAWDIGECVFGSDGKKQRAIHVDASSRKLMMNGRDVFNFAATVIPHAILDSIEKNHLHIEQIDRFLIHQGSQFIVDTIQQKLGVSKDKMPFCAQYYGNTVSSSLPMLLKDSMLQDKMVLICGFGVGLSWGSCVLRRNLETSL